MKWTRAGRAEAKAVRKGKGLPEAVDAHNKRVRGDEVARKRRANEQKVQDRKAGRYDGNGGKR